MIVGAGFGEETIFRGYLFERLGKLFGTGAGAKVSIVLLTSAVFALGHYSNLGLPGVEQAMITGLVFGTIFAVTGPDLDADVRACRVRSDGGRDNLLEYRSRCGSPCVQIAKGGPTNRFVRISTNERICLTRRCSQPLADCRGYNCGLIKSRKLLLRAFVFRFA